MAPYYLKDNGDNKLMNSEKKIKMQNLTKNKTWIKILMNSPHKEPLFFSKPTALMPKSSIKVK
jgi:hypothetical protein